MDTPKFVILLLVFFIIMYFMLDGLMIGMTAIRDRTSLRANVDSLLLQNAYPGVSRVYHTIRVDTEGIEQDLPEWTKKNMSKNAQVRIRQIDKEEEMPILALEFRTPLKMMSLSLIDRENVHMYVRGRAAAIWDAKE